MRSSDTITTVLQGTNGTVARAESTGGPRPFRHLQILSLWEMLQFEAPYFFVLLQALDRLRRHVRSCRRQKSRLNPYEIDRGLLDAVEEQCKLLAKRSLSLFGTRHAPSVNRRRSGSPSASR